MRAFLISDTHFGSRNNNLDWLDLKLDFFEKQFIPFIEKYKNKDDIMIHNGDVFDSRQSLNLTVMSKVIDLFTKLSKKFDKIYIIAGNHDAARKTDNEITSLDCLRFIPNIFIIKEPTIYYFDNQKTLLMPYTHGRDKEVIEMNKDVDYIFCHADFNFVSFDGIRNMEHGLSEGDLIGDDKKIKKIYSGHIHHRQESGILTMLGNPYQMTRSDRNNKKGFWCFDFENGNDFFIENIVSPKFEKIILDESVLKLTFDEMIKISKNNRIDLYVPTEYFSRSFNSFVKELGNYTKSIDVFPIEKDFVYNENIDQYADGLDLNESYRKFITTKYGNSLYVEKLIKRFANLYKKFER